MEINERFKFYGEYDITNIKRILEESDLDWEKMRARQARCYEMKSTQTIPIVYDTNFGYANYNPIYWDSYKLFEQELNNISEIIKKNTNGEGYLLRAILVKLLKQSFIPTHVDFVNETLIYSHRIHIPIITNNNCIFIVDKEERNLKVGEIWEVNNDKLEHSVHNNGDEDRVHLIIDWCKKPLPK